MQLEPQKHKSDKVMSDKFLIIIKKNKKKTLKTGQTPRRHLF